MILDCAVYEDGRRTGSPELHRSREAATKPGAFVWVRLHEPTAEDFAAVRGEFGLHDLAVEDAIKAHQRPKLETYGDMLFLVLRPARYVDHVEVVTIDEVMLFAGPDYVVSVRHGQTTVLDDVAHAAQDRPEILAHGPGGLVYAIVDAVVDGYAPVVEGVEEDIQGVEEEVFSEDRTNAARRIYKLKREVLEFQRAVVPLASPIEQLARRFDRMFGEDLTAYLRDVHDHVLRISAQVESQRDLLTSILEANMAQVAVRQNEDTRRISAWVAIAAVPTAVAGIYGMNFEHMPELGWTFGYPLVLGLMAAVCVGLYVRFRRVGWL
jgi:magnesium transporter